MPGVVWVGKGERAHVWYAYAEGKRFTLLFEDNVMTGRGRWKLVLPGGSVEEITHPSGSDVRLAQIAAEDKIEAFLRKGYVA